MFISFLFNMNIYDGRVENYQPQKYDYKRKRMYLLVTNGQIVLVWRFPGLILALHDTKHRRSGETRICWNKIAVLFS